MLEKCTFAIKILTMKRHLPIFLLLFCSVSLNAQETTFWKKVNGFLTKPDKADSTFIYQPLKGFTLGVCSSGGKAGFDAKVDFRIDNYYDGAALEGVSTYALAEKLCKKVGLEASYGNFNLGFSFEIGPRSARKKNAFGLSFLNKAWGVHFNISKITNPFTTGLTIGNEGDENYFHHEYTTEEDAEMKSFSIDGYYVFNNQRFAYPAAYKFGFEQRRTAGSWLLTARYMQGSLTNSPEVSWDTYNFVDIFSTWQASVGGGYSVNFVLWLRDPTDLRDHGLRNLTLNLTALPVLTVFNYLKTTSYEYDDNGNKTGEATTKVLCHPMPNYIGSAAISLSLGRVYFSTQFTYNMFYFRSNDAFNAKHMEIPEYVDKLSYRGSFHDWTLKGLVLYRF